MFGHRPESANLSPAEKMNPFSYPDLAHIHIVLNHFPTIGTVLGLGLLITALWTRSEELKRSSFVVLVLMALLGIPTYLTGTAAADRFAKNPFATRLALEQLLEEHGLDPAALAEEPDGVRTALEQLLEDQGLDTSASGDFSDVVLHDSGVSAAAIEFHQNSAMLAFLLLGITGTLAWLALWHGRRVSSIPATNINAVLLLTVITVGLMIRTGTLGGDINHPEIRTGEEVASAADISWRYAGRDFINVHSWTWPAAETLHFIGLSMLFGVAFLVNLRVMGMIRDVSFPALHRLLPVAIFGFLLCLLTGMLFFVGLAERYVVVPTFAAKIMFIVLAGINLIYFTVFEQPWRIGPGDDAPLTAKIVSVVTLACLIGALYFGRMIPFLEY